LGDNALLFLPLPTITLDFTLKVYNRLLRLALAAANDNAGLLVKGFCFGNFKPAGYPFRLIRAYGHTGLYLKGS